MTDNIPEWAKEEACRLANSVPTRGVFAPFQVHQIRYNRAMTAFAEYIAEHGTEPIDPDLLLARQIAADLCSRDETAKVYLTGKWDNLSKVKAALAAIKAVRKETLS